MILTPLHKRDPTLEASQSPRPQSRPASLNRALTAQLLPELATAAQTMAETEDLTVIPRSSSSPAYCETETDMGTWHDGRETHPTQRTTSRPILLHSPPARPPSSRPRQQCAGSFGKGEPISTLTEKASPPSLSVPPDDQLSARGVLGAGGWAKVG